MFKSVILKLPAFLCLIVSVAFAQDSTQRVYTFQNSVTFSGIGALRVFSAQNNYMNGNASGLEVAYNINTANNRNDWVRMMQVKNIGIAFAYRNMENVYLTQRAGTTGFLGDAYSLISRLDVALFKIKGVDFFLTPGFGFAYATRSFRTNYNPLIGSHINFAAQIGGKVQLPLSATTRIEMGLNLFHYSNAAFKLPNDGVNTINATVGIVRNINYTEPLRKIDALNINRKSSVEFGLGIVG